MLWSTTEAVCLTVHFIEGRYVVLYVYPRVSLLLAYDLVLSLGGESLYVDILIRIALGDALEVTYRLDSCMKVILLKDNGEPDG